MVSREISIGSRKSYRDSMCGATSMARGPKLILKYQVLQKKVLLARWVRTRKSNLGRSVPQTRGSLVAKQGQRPLHPLAKSIKTTPQPQLCELRDNELCNPLDVLDLPTRTSHVSHASRPHVSHQCYLFHPPI